MKKAKQFKVKQIFFKMLLLVAIFIAPKMNAQTSYQYASLQLSSDITGSGLGGNVCPSVALTLNKSTFSIGPNFQRKRMNFSGFQTNYRYSVAKNDNGKREIFFYGNITFHNSARMADSYIKIEESCDSENPFDYESMRLKVLESYVGLGIKLNPSKQFSTFFRVGMGVFDTMNKNYNREMYREKSGVVIQLNVSVVYNFNQFGK